MSVIKLSGEKVELPRESDGFWLAIAESYAEQKPRRWRYLAALTLHEVCGWKLAWIAAAVGCRDVTVRRQITRAKSDLFERFEPGAEVNRDEVCDGAGI